MAVIDIGSSAIRMTIASVDGEGALHPLESLRQSVSIGKDTFKKGYIEKATIEECVRALRTFSSVLAEYGIREGRRVRVVATTAVREASNSEVFRDRILIACGWRVAILDLADIARLTYMGVQPFFQRKEFSSVADVLIVEMGGGGTELSFISKKGAAFSQSFAIGSLRLRQYVDNLNLPFSRQQSYMEQGVKRCIDQIVSMVHEKSNFAIVALGSEIRHAAAGLHPGWDGVSPVTVTLPELTRYAEKHAAAPFQKIGKRGKISFVEADTLGPTLLFYTRLAQRLKKNRLIIASTSMRHGILLEMAGFDAAGDSFKRNILASAEVVASKYHADLAHARNVTALAQIIFEALQNEHRMKPHDALLLSVAGLLHDVGFFIAPRNHHKHSMYLIKNSELFGLNSRDITTVSLVARYHRRSSPKPTHAEFMMLEFDDRIRVAKLSAILRVADALDQAHAGRIRRISCDVSNDVFTISVPDASDVSLEELALRNKGPLFEEIYGLRPRVQAGG